MAGDYIKVSLSAMESCGQSFLNCSDTVVAIAQSLATASAAMKTAWDDPAQATFEAAMEGMLKDFDKLHACLSAMSSYTYYVAELYKTTDQAAKNLL